MGASELRLMVRSGLVEVGAHSVHHLMLAQHPLQVQRTEIAESKRQLEQAIGRPVNSFAYPYGGKSAVDNRTVECVREAGFGLACDNVPGAIGNDTDPFALPRLLVRDWDSSEFRRRVESAFAQ